MSTGSEDRFHKEDIKREKTNLFDKQYLSQQINEEVQEKMDAQDKSLSREVIQDEVDTEIKAVTSGLQNIHQADILQYEVNEHETTSNQNPQNRISLKVRHDNTDSTMMGNISVATSSTMNVQGQNRELVHPNMYVSVINSGSQRWVHD